MGSMKCPECEEGWCDPIEVGDNYGHGKIWKCDNCSYSFEEYYKFDDYI